MRESPPAASASTNSRRSFEDGERRRKREIAEFFDRLAPERDRWRARNAAYYEAIERLARFVVPPGARVLEVGCGTGDLLAALRPSFGVGVDLSAGMLEVARRRHPALTFVEDDAETLASPALSGQTFDFIVLSDVVGCLVDIWAAFRALRRFCTPATRLLITYYNFLWQPVLDLGEALGQKMPLTQQNWLGRADLTNLLQVNQFEIIRSGTAELLPFALPPLSPVVNRHFASLPVLRHLALTQFFVARLPARSAPPAVRDYTCSVIVPCKNERGNIDDIVERVPALGSGTEIVFVDGNSDDGTVEAIERHLTEHTRPNLKLLHQGQGKGKGDAVRKGFAAAEGDILFILDADLTVAPEDLPKFYQAMAEGVGEFINGSRLVYPMEGEAMRFLNSLGNKFFSLALTATLEQPLKDTLCGTKVLFRSDYQKLAAGRSFFGEFDPFGDFDLLFGAAKLNLRIVEMPVRYRARTYGTTKISRFRHGAQLARMTGYAYQKFRQAY